VTPHPRHLILAKNLLKNEAPSHRANISILSEAMKSTQLILALLAAFCLTNCASMNRPITQQGVDQIVVGQTTRADLVQLFGPPTTETGDIEGETSLDWYYAPAPQAQTFIPILGAFFTNDNRNLQQLSVLIGVNGRVKNYTVNSDPMSEKSGSSARSPLAYAGIAGD